LCNTGSSVMAACEVMNIMIDIIIYASGYVLASKLIGCHRDRFIKTHIGDILPSTEKITNLCIKGLKKQSSLFEKTLLTTEQLNKSQIK